MVCWTLLEICCENVFFYVNKEAFLILLYLFGFIFLVVARRNQTVRIDAFIAGSCIAL